MTKIFISHSSKDTEFAKQLATALTEIGIDVWIDVDSIRAGKRWSSEIQRGLDQADALLLITSPDAMSSANVQDEWFYFLNQRKRIIVVRWKPSRVHYQLSGIQYIDFHERDFGAAFSNLRKELQFFGFSSNKIRGRVYIAHWAGASHSPDNETAIPTTVPPFVRDTVFISYSHDDAIWLDRLQTMLTPLMRAEPTMHIFVDRVIKPGEKWKTEIIDALNRSKIGILLLTPNFLASDFIMETELPILLEAYNAKQVNILAIGVSANGYEYTPLKEIQFMNDPERPLDSLTKSRRNTALKQIVKQIEEAFKKA